ncbi:MAG: hypothetical protein AAFU54_22565 [Chloroflexota bacterium]
MRLKTLCGALMMALVGLFFLLPATADAQLAGICDEIITLESGNSVERTITDIDFIWAFCFDGRVGDIVTINANVPDGDLDGFLTVVDEETEDIIAELPFMTAATTPDDLVFRVDETSSYVIVIGRDGRENGSSTGSFSIELIIEGNSAAGSVADGDCPPNTQSISAGDELTGTISNNDYFVAYCFDAAAGDVVSVEANADADLDTLLILTDAGLETTLDENDDCSFDTLNSCIEYEIEDDGTYVVAVGRYDTVEGATTGDFTVTFDVAGNDDAETPEGFTPPGTKDDPPGSSSAAPADCDSTPIRRLVDSNWEIDTDDLQMRFVFDCDGAVAVNVNGDDIGTATYTVETLPDDTLTLTINTGSAEIAFTRVVVTTTTISALLNDETFIAMTSTGR